MLGKSGKVSNIGNKFGAPKLPDLRKCLATVARQCHNCAMGISGEMLRDTRAFVLDRTQQELADALGVSLRTIVNWEAKGVPERNEYRVRRAIGAALDEWAAQLEKAEASRDSWDIEAAYEDWISDPVAQERRAQEERDAEIMDGHRQAGARRRSAGGIAGATDAELLNEIMRRLKARHMSEASYTLAADDTDYESENEAMMEEP